MKKNILILFTMFCVGYVTNDMVQSLFVAPAKADVAGMDRYDLKYDYDFKRAVEDIVEGCSIYDNMISC